MKFTFYCHQLQLILLFIIVFLVSCAPESRTPLWITSLESLPPIKGFSKAGVFTINKKIYVQYCDSGGNQIWMRHDAYANKWKQTRQNYGGCINGDNSTGPEDE